MNARVVTHRFDLRTPYTIAYETISEAVNHFLILEGDDGVSGTGCAAPAPEVTGESPESSRDALDAFAASVNSGMPVIEALARIPAANPSARAAAETSMLDLEGVRTSRPMCTLLGGADSAPTPGVISRPISVTIGICGLEETVRLARTHIDAGFGILKVKGGHDVAADVDRLKAVRDAAGPDVAIALDANQGYDLRDVETLSTAQSVLALSFLEQPTPRDGHAMLVEASSLSDVPVMADETVRTEDDVLRLIDLGGVDLINIKLQKVGGPGPALRIDALAAEAGMPVMLGCMDESALSIAAALHFGQARPNVSWFDLDGHLDLIADPFEGMLDLRDGILSLEVRAGTGSTGLADVAGA